LPQVPLLHADQKSSAANLREVRKSKPLFTFGNSGDFRNVKF